MTLFLECKRHDSQFQIVLVLALARNKTPPGRNPGTKRGSPSQTGARSSQSSDRVQNWSCVELVGHGLSPRVPRLLDGKTIRIFIRIWATMLLHKPRTAETQEPGPGARSRWWERTDIVDLDPAVSPKYGMKSSRLKGRWEKGNDYGKTCSAEFQQGLAPRLPGLCRGTENISR